MPLEMMFAPFMSPALVFALGAPSWLIAAYFFMVWDSRRDGSASKDDGQMGLKLVAFFLLLIGLSIGVGGIVQLLHYLLSGAKTGKDALKGSIAGVIAGAAAIFAVMVLILPRTNSAQYAKATRYCAGFVAAIAGAVGLYAFYMLLTGLIVGAPWPSNSGNLAMLIVFGGLGGVAINKLGTLSSWTAPARPVFPAQGGGMPPQGGYGGGYPPQGGGYPPQGGGYPPR